MSERTRWAVGQAVAWVVSIAFLAWVASWFDHPFLGIRSVTDLVRVALVALVVMTPLLWLAHPLEKRSRDERARRRRVKTGA
ncbi:hypothetical protein [Mobilicoccus pelagius]|uniref:Uncharacterized protein n=1 Tax=Mobilicoccus pelagius NBRC 104925 TaxID=1089455 RepID=H5UMD5_9MICO|nr:hypothetical protein [Mobilicoccus pelagius]GAB46893.1 hypothetical protein MOPEL_001_00110 [Mobilicoccus pelagius NBRC 104925]